MSPTRAQRQFAKKTLSSSICFNLEKKLPEGLVDIFVSNKQRHGSFLLKPLPKPNKTPCVAFCAVAATTPVLYLIFGKYSNMDKENQKKKRNTKRSLEKEKMTRSRHIHIGSLALPELALLLLRFVRLAAGTD